MLCSVANLRAILSNPPEPACPRRCAQGLANQIDTVERLTGRGTSAATPRKCQRVLRKSVKASLALRRRIDSLVGRGRLMPGDRGQRLAAEADGLARRADTLAAAFCRSLTSPR